jgi:transcriptional regulator
MKGISYSDHKLDWLVLNRSEKQKSVIELYNQGKTIRQIAQIVHMSFGDISFIIRQETGEAGEQERIRMSKASQALKLFEQGNNPVQVAIKLDIQTQEIERLYKEYWKLNGLYKLNEIYADLKDNIFSFVKLFEFTKKEGMTPQQVIDVLKIAEEISNLQAERQHIEDCIDEDWPKIFELKRQKEALTKELHAFQEHVEFARETTSIDISKQKESLAQEVDNYKSFLSSELKSLQVDIDKLKQEEQQLTCSIQRLKYEARQELYVQRSQSRPQLIYQQPVQQETPNLSEEEQRILAIPLKCNNWESKWGELMHRAWTR